MDKEKTEREKYYRVTEILCPFNGYGAAPAELMRKYQDRGTRVHTACNAVVQGIGSAWCDDDIKGYVQSFEKWWSPNYKVVEMNKRYFDDELEITGELDLLIQTEKGTVLIDFKTLKSVQQDVALSTICIQKDG